MVLTVTGLEPVRGDPICFQDRPSSHCGKPSYDHMNQSTIVLYTLPFLLINIFYTQS
jgi:hypothetical protein